MASGADTHTHIHTHTHTHTRILTSRTKAISRNQARTGRRPARAWFKNHVAFSKINFSTIALQANIAELSEHVDSCFDHDNHDLLLPYFHSDSFLSHKYDNLIKSNKHELGGRIAQLNKIIESLNRDEHCSKMPRHCCDYYEDT